MHERQIIIELLSEMRAFSVEACVDLKTLSKRATGNAEFYDRLEAGGDATTAVVIRVRNHMQANRPIAQSGEDAA